MMIRIMRPDDYDRVWALWMSCPRLALNNLDDSPEGVARFLQYLKESEEGEYKW